MPTIMGGAIYMTAAKKIVINIPKEKLELMKQLGISPQDVFFKGFQELLRQKYREFSLVDDEDDLEYIELSELTNTLNEVDKLMVNENDISNN